MTTIAPKKCRLRFVATGELELCPGEDCAFWEPGGAVVPGNCILDRLGVDLGENAVASYLLEVRQRVEAARLQAKGELQ